MGKGGVGSCVFEGRNERGGGGGKNNMAMMEAMWKERRGGVI